MTTNDAPARPAGRRGSTGSWLERERAVRRYLSALESAKPGRDSTRTADSITRRIHKLDELMVSADPLTRLHLAQERVELHAERLRIGNGRQTSLAELEREFVRAARAYGDRMGISYAAWRQMGVDTGVLDRASIARPVRRGGPPPASSPPRPAAASSPDGPVADPGAAPPGSPPPPPAAQSSPDGQDTEVPPASVAAWLSEPGDVEARPR